MIRGADSIDLALEIIEMVREPGMEVNTRMIAELAMEIDPDVPVHHQDIYFLEKRALGKMRKALEAAERAARRKAALA